MIPISIRKVAAEIKAHVRAKRVICLEDCDLELQIRWEETCDHELFYQDANRYIEDVYQDAVMDGTFNPEPWTVEARMKSVF